MDFLRGCVFKKDSILYLCSHITNVKMTLELNTPDTKDISPPHYSAVY